MEECYPLHTTYYFLFKKMFDTSFESYSDYEFSTSEFAAQLEQTMLIPSSDVPLDLKPGDFGYHTYVLQPQITKALCKDSEIIPDGAWGISLTEDGYAKSWMTRGGVQFSPRGQQWWEEVNAKHEAREAAATQQRIADRAEREAQAEWDRKHSIENEWSDYTIWK